jgi:hypothetical protein
MASKVSYHDIKDALIATQGKSTLRKKISTLQIGTIIKKHMAGSFIVADFEVVGIAGPELEYYLYHGPRWQEELELDKKFGSKTQDTIVLKDKDGDYHTWPLEDAIQQLECQLKDNFNITPLG